MPLATRDGATKAKYSADGTRMKHQMQRLGQQHSSVPPGPEGWAVPGGKAGPEGGEKNPVDHSIMVFPNESDRRKSCCMLCAQVLNKAKLEYIFE